MKTFTMTKGLAALALTALAAGCGGYTTGGNFDGLPLAEFDTTGLTPRGVSLGGVDTLIVTRGDDFTIDVEGDEDATSLVRFNMEDDMLKVGRARGSSRDTAIINVTLPSVVAASVGGSGRLELDRLSGDAAISVGGSGEARIGEIDAEALKVSVGGSGDLVARGRAKALDLAVGGSGDADLEGVSVDRARVAVGGSGDASLTSNGQVTGAVGGSGDLRVSGGATCNIKTSGSGSVDC